MSFACFSPVEAFGTFFFFFLLFPKSGCSQNPKSDYILSTKPLERMGALRSAGYCKPFIAVDYLLLMDTTADGAHSGENWTSWLELEFRLEV